MISDVFGVPESPFIVIVELPRCVAADGRELVGVDPLVFSYRVFYLPPLYVFVVKRQKASINGSDDTPYNYK
jgi:hypothetical protein